MKKTGRTPSTRGSATTKASSARPAALRKRFTAIKEARNEIAKELRRAERLKKRYEKAVEAFFDQIEEDPSEYQYQERRGGETVNKRLTLTLVRKHRRAFRKAMGTQDAVALLGDWDDCECPEESWCVRLNCDPGPLNSCCYLCLSFAPIHCHFS